MKPKAERIEIIIKDDLTYLKNITIKAVGYRVKSKWYKRIMDWLKFKQEIKKL